MSFRFHYTMLVRDPGGGGVQHFLGGSNFSRGGGGGPIAYSL